MLLKPRRWFTPESAVERRHVRAWTDAAGDTKYIAAVVLNDGKILFTRLRVPDEMFDTFIPREDNYIRV